MKLIKKLKINVELIIMIFSFFYENLLKNLKMAQNRMNMVYKYKPFQKIHTTVNIKTGNIQLVGMEIAVT